MNKNIIIGTSHLIFVIHVIVILIILLGSFISEIRLIYQSILIITIISWFSSMGCILTVWEYKLRKIINPDLELYEFGFIDFYLRKYLSGSARPKFIYAIGLFFLITSLGINIFVYGFLPIGYVNNLY